MKNFRWERPLLTQLLREGNGADHGKILSAFKEDFGAGGIGDHAGSPGTSGYPGCEIIDDRSRVRVETKDNVFIDVMSTVVNIFRRVAGGCELSFVGFAYKD